MGFNAASTILPIQVIAPSLQLTAQTMTGLELNVFTEQVRDRFLENDFQGVKRLLDGHKIQASTGALHQIAAGRVLFFGEDQADTDFLYFVDSIIFNEANIAYNVPCFFEESPSLREAALRMSGMEFNEFTEQVRDLLFEKDGKNLIKLLDSNRIDIFDSTICQILDGRKIFFGEILPIKVEDALTEYAANIGGNTFDARKEMVATAISLGEHSEIPWLSEALLDKQNAIPNRMAAAHALGKIGGPKSIEALIKALGDDGDHHIKFEIEESLVAMGETAVEPLVAALNGDKSTCMSTAHILSRIKDPRSIKPLLNVLLEDKHEDPVIARVMTKALCKMSDNLEVYFGLMQALKHGHWWVREAAKTALKIT